MKRNEFKMWTIYAVMMILLLCFAIKEGSKIDETYYVANPDATAAVHYVEVER